MPDDLFERRLRAALRDGADSLPFTISPSELDRRVALRTRGQVVPRRMLLLAAAAIGIGLVGIGALIGGAIPQRAPTPSAPVNAVQPSSSAGLAGLPALDDLIAAAPGTVLVAQAHDRIDPQSSDILDLRGTRGSVDLGELWARGDLRIGIACLGDSSMDYDVRTEPGSSPGTPIECDGTVHEATITIPSPARVVLSYQEPTSWRIVVRGELAALPLPTENRIIPAADASLQELEREDDRITNADGEPWGDGSLRLQEVSPIPGRAGYGARIWCRFGDSVRLIFGDHIEGVITAETETAIACTGLIHDLDLRMAQPAGSRVFIAATPGTAWSLLVTSEQPPIELAAELPGWQHETTFGPDFAFQEHGVSMSGAGEGVVSIQVVLACTGTEPIDVIVQDGSPIGAHAQHFTATCSPEGFTTTRVLAVSPSGVDVGYTAPKGTWTALALNVPK